MTELSGQLGGESQAIDIAILEDVWGPEFEALKSRWAITHAPEAWQDASAIADLSSRARAIVVRNRTTVSRALLEAAPRLQIVARAGVGLDNIATEAANDLGIVVVAATGANARSVAEHALGLAIALARDIVGHDRRVREGRWERRLGNELEGRTWGVVGLGNTGSAVARLASAFGMKVVGYDPYLPASPPPVRGLRRLATPLQLARVADVISLHAPLTKDTEELVNRAFLAEVKPDALLINLARGALVDEEALADALDEGRLGGAALDVRAQEPSRRGRLEGHERVILTPHVAGLTVEAQRIVARMLAEDVDAILAGRGAARAVGQWRQPGAARD